MQRKRLFIPVVLAGLLCLPATGKDKYVPFRNSAMYQKEYIDLNKNGKMDPYENPHIGTTMQ